MNISGLILSGQMRVYLFPEEKPVNPAHFYQTGITDTDRKDDRSRTASAGVTSQVMRLSG